MWVGHCRFPLSRLVSPLAYLGPPKDTKGRMPVAIGKRLWSFELWRALSGGATVGGTAQWDDATGFLKHHTIINWQEERVGGKRVSQKRGRRGHWANTFAKLMQNALNPLETKWSCQQICYLSPKWNQDPSDESLLDMRTLLFSEPQPTFNLLDPIWNLCSSSDITTSFCFLNIGILSWWLFESYEIVIWRKRFWTSRTKKTYYLFWGIKSCSHVARAYVQCKADGSLRWWIPIHFIITLVGENERETLPLLRYDNAYLSILVPRLWTPRS